MTRLTRPLLRTATLGLAVVVVAACGGSPFLSLGNRSSRWINEPKVTTTTVARVDAPSQVSVSELRWANDDIVSGPFENVEEVVATVFARRQGDRFIQASRVEITAAVPDVRFPSVAPFGAEWVSSQLVVENNGTLSAEPTAAFGIWSAEPYTRSRSVAQMVVVRVAHDPDTAAEVGDPEGAFSCARFAEEATDECALIRLESRPYWRLTSSSGVTLVWFEGDYRYEMFGRNSVPIDVLQAMATETLPLAELGG